MSDVEAKAGKVWDEEKKKILCFILTDICCRNMEAIYPLS